MLDNFDIVNLTAVGSITLLLGYTTFWAFNIRRALAVRIYRNQAAGIGLVAASLAVANAVSTSIAYFVIQQPQSAFNQGPSIVLYFSAFVVIFYWIDASALAGRRSDPLLRNTFHWRKARVVLWGAIVSASIGFFSAAAYLQVQTGFLLNPPSSGALPPTTPVVPLVLILIAIVTVPFVTFISGVVLLPLVVRRSKDSALRGHLKWFGLFSAFVLVFFVLLGIYGPFGPIGSLFSVYLSLVGGGYCLYRSARSLAPLNKLSLVELTSPLGKETSLRPNVSYGQLVKASSVRH